MQVIYILSRVHRLPSMANLDNRLSQSGIRLNMIPRVASWLINFPIAALRRYPASLPLFRKDTLNVVDQ